MVLPRVCDGFLLGLKLYDITPSSRLTVATTGFIRMITRGTPVSDCVVLLRTGAHIADGAHPSPGVRRHCWYYFGQFFENAHLTVLTVTGDFYGIRKNGATLIVLTVTRERGARY